jgi:hypothetical protein
MGTVLTLATIAIDFMEGQRPRAFLKAVAVHGTMVASDFFSDLTADLLNGGRIRFISGHHTADATPTDGDTLHLKSVNRHIERRALKDGRPSITLRLRWQISK